MEYLPPPAPDEEKPQEAKRPRASGALGAMGAAALAFVLKFKFLLFFGVKIFSVSWTFLLSLWLYVLLWGWKLGIVIVLVILAHELGHYFAFRAYGLPVKLPAFVPLLGAYTTGMAPDDLEHDANIALAGPLTGLGLAVLCYAFGLYTHDRFWYACADVSAFINLFNMIPMPPFDGGRIAAALWRPLWAIGVALFFAFAFFFHIGIIFIVLIALFALPAVFAAWKGPVDPRSLALTFEARLRISLWYLATLGGLILVMAQAHAGASVSNAGSLSL